MLYKFAGMTKLLEEKENCWCKCIATQHKVPPAETTDLANPFYFNTNFLLPKNTQVVSKKLKESRKIGLTVVWHVTFALFTALKSLNLRIKTEPRADSAYFLQTLTGFTYVLMWVCLLS